MNYNQVPDNLPEPQNDGAADHLKGMRLPSVSLRSTNGDHVNVGQHPGWLVIYCYPMTGVPGVALPPHWDQIPGARGCTPQTNAYKEIHPQLHAWEVGIFGLSSQSTAYQQELAQRLQLPFAILSDENLHFQQALQLPTFVSENKTLLKRLTLIAKEGVIQTVHYPVFPSHEDAQWVISQLRMKFS